MRQTLQNECTTNSSSHREFSRIVNKYIYHTKQFPNGSTKSTLVGYRHYLSRYQWNRTHKLRTFHQNQSIWWIKALVEDSICSRPSRSHNWNRRLFEETIWIILTAFSTLYFVTNLSGKFHHCHHLQIFVHLHVNSFCGWEGSSLIQYLYIGKLYIYCCLGSWNILLLEWKEQDNDEYVKLYITYILEQSMGETAFFSAITNPAMSSPGSSFLYSFWTKVPSVTQILIIVTRRILVNLRWCFMAELVKLKVVDLH